MSELPIVVIGAGPQGLAAAAHLLERGLEPLVLEAGAEAASAVDEWKHVRLFSGWPELVDAASRRLLEPTGWVAPPAGYPTGGEWRAFYLNPLAEALGVHVRYGSRVVSVRRPDDDGPFHVEVLGSKEAVLARAVIDASGTWALPNPAGASGKPAVGEAEAGDLLSYRIPALDDIEQLTGKHVVVVGSGHSAITALTALAAVGQGTRVTWVLRRATADSAFGGGEADELPARGALGRGALRLIDEGVVELVTGFRTTRIESVPSGALLIAEDGREQAADHVVVLTGFHPDLTSLSSLRLDLDPELQAPRRIAAQIDPRFHSCGTVTATGARDLAHPEKDFYLVGAKSYGRAPTFLALTGYEQVRSIAAALAGDHKAAARVDLELPATGVCGGTGLVEAPSASGGCCEQSDLPIPRFRGGIVRIF